VDKTFYVDSGLLPQPARQELAETVSNILRETKNGNVQAWWETQGKLRERDDDRLRVLDLVKINDPELKGWETTRQRLQEQTMRDQRVALLLPGLKQELENLNLGLSQHPEHCWPEEWKKQLDDLESRNKTAEHAAKRLPQLRRQIQEITRMINEKRQRLDNNQRKERQLIEARKTQLKTASDTMDELMKPFKKWAEFVFSRGSQRGSRGHPEIMSKRFGLSNYVRLYFRVSTENPVF
jgi:hypothetical protein